MNEKSTNNNNKHAQYPLTDKEAFKKYPDETGYSVPPNYTDSEWEAYLEWNKQPVVPLPDTINVPTTQERIDNNEMSWNYPKGTKHTPEYYRKEGKPEWNLVDFPSLEPLVRALEYGKKKHGAFSYQKFIPKDILLDKLYRHIIEIHKGNFIDEETGAHHIGGVLANAMFYSLHHRENDLSSVSTDTPIEQYIVDVKDIPNNETIESTLDKLKFFMSTRGKLTKKAKVELERKKILELVALGLSDTSIGLQLGLNRRTVQRRRLNR